MRRVLVLSIMGIGLWAGSVVAQKTLDEIVARVNSDIILRSEYQEMEQSLEEELSQQMQGSQLERALEEGKTNLLRTMIDNHLLLQKAEGPGYDRRPGGDQDHGTPQAGVRLRKPRDARVRDPTAGSGYRDLQGEHRDAVPHATGSSARGLPEDHHHDRGPSGTTTRKTRPLSTGPRVSVCRKSCS